MPDKASTSGVQLNKTNSQSEQPTLANITNEYTGLSKKTPINALAQLASKAGLISMAIQESNNIRTGRSHSNVVAGQMNWLSKRTSIRSREIN